MTLYQKKTIFHDYCTGKNEENWTIFSSNCLCYVLHIFNDWMTNPSADCYWNIKCQDCINDVVLYIYIKKSFCFLWIDTNKNMELKTLQPFLNYLDNYYVCDFFLMMHHMHHNWLHFTNQKITKEKSFGKNSLHFDLRTYICYRYFKGLLTSFAYIRWKNLNKELNKNCSNVIVY